MPSKLYELHPFQGERRVRSIDRLLVSLDLSDADATDDLLRRHLIAVALREGVRRTEAHMFHLEIHEVRNGRPEHTVLFTFSVPVEA